MPNRSRVLDPNHPLDQFAQRLRRLQRTAMARAHSIADLDKIKIDKVADTYNVSRATIYATLSGRRLASPQTLLALVLAWDPRGEAYEEWLELRSATERALALLTHGLPPASSNESPDQARSQPRLDERKEFASVMKRLRVMAGSPTLRQISRKTDHTVSASAISTYLTGRSLPSLENLEAILAAIDADQSDHKEAYTLWSQARRRASEPTGEEADH